MSGVALERFKEGKSAGKTNRTKDYRKQIRNTKNTKNQTPTKERSMLYPISIIE